ncbi:MAG: undecaprenyl-diphosphate phosphatase, partial [bacterium]
VQGLTEFLPVSSSGHLVIIEAFFHLKETLTFDVFLHIATLLAVVWAYRADLVAVLKSDKIGTGDQPISKWKFIALIAISLVATGVIWPFKDKLESLFETIYGVRVLLIINALALGILPLLRRGAKGLGSLNWLGAVIIGLAQAIGAFPGISRSGSTIIAGLLLGLKPSEACRYSFILAIPTILVAAVTQIPDALKSGAMPPFGPAFAGFMMALIAGLIAIPRLIGIVEKGKLWGFAIYCAIIGIALFLIPI